MSEISLYLLKKIITPLLIMIARQKFQKLSTMMLQLIM